MYLSAKRLSTACSLLPILFLIQSCTQEPIPAQSLEPQPSMLVDHPTGVLISEHCTENEGSVLTFVLDVEDPMDDTGAGGEMPVNFDYNIFLGYTPPYNLGIDCICRLSGYTFTFSNLSQVSWISVIDDTGAQVSFTQSGNTIEIDPSYLGANLFIDFDPGPPTPTLVTAGGFCIVDNVSTPEEPRTLHEAYIEHTYNPITMQTTKKVYIPASVATGFYP